MSSYKVLNKQVFSSGNFSIVPIRIEDRFEIMKWRNEQIYYLRQFRLFLYEYLIKINYCILINFSLL
jgi:hypothetical protein